MPSLALAVPPPAPVLTDSDPRLAGQRPQARDQGHRAGRLDGDALHEPRLRRHDRRAGAGRDVHDHRSHRDGGRQLHDDVLGERVVGSEASPCSSAGLTYVEDPAPPPAPTVSDTVPASPSADNTPLVRGSAADGTTVCLYANAALHGRGVRHRHRGAVRVDGDRRPGRRQHVDVLLRGRVRRRLHLAVLDDVRALHPPAPEPPRHRSSPTAIRTRRRTTTCRSSRAAPWPAGSCASTRTRPAPGRASARATRPTSRRPGSADLGAQRRDDDALRHGRRCRRRRARRARRAR